LRKRLSLLLLCVASPLLAFGQTPQSSSAQAPPRAVAAQEVGTIVPVEEESNHIPMWHNEFVTLLRVDIPAGRTTGYHLHTRDQLGVVVAPYPGKGYSQLLGKPPNPLRHPPLGDVTFAGYDTPVTHHIVNPDTTPIDQYGVMLNSQKPWGFSPGTRDVPGYTVVMDNERARGWRLVLAPGETAPAITQTAPGIRIVVRGGEIAEISPGKPARGMMLPQREASWQQPGATRAGRNIGSTTIEVVEFELK